MNLILIFVHSLKDFIQQKVSLARRLQTGIINYRIAVSVANKIHSYKADMWQALAISWSPCWLNGNTKVIVKKIFQHMLSYNHTETLHYIWINHIFVTLQSLLAASSYCVVYATSEWLVCEYVSGIDLLI